jgi:Raf kinase inhibitor-like YbhB/YbcL family protein
MTFDLTSSAFSHEAPIPARYTCDGEDMSPPLAWSDAPQGTTAFALIMDDPDAPRGVFTHWVLFNVPAQVQDLPEAVPKTARLADRGLQGRNDFGKVGYGGPCPPPGPPHRYRFTLYALDIILDLSPGASKQQVLEAIQDHTLDHALLIGTYRRAQR